MISDQSMRLRSCGLTMLTGYLICCSRKCQISPNASEEIPSPPSTTTLGFLINLTLSEPKSAPLSTNPEAIGTKSIPDFLAMSPNTFSKSEPKFKFPLRAMIKEPALKRLPPLSKGTSEYLTLIFFFNNSPKNLTSVTEFHLAT